MRNVTNEQARAIALNVVLDHLRAGIESIDIAEGVDDTFFGEDDEATQGDYDATNTAVEAIVANLISQLEQDQ